METLVSVIKKTIGNENSRVRRTKQNRLMLEPNSVVCGNKKSRFVKNQEANTLELH